MNELSHYSADDSDNINEYTNYWRNWEYMERMASATTCDFMAHCYECPELCENSEPLHLEHVFTPDTPYYQTHKLLGVIRNEELEWWYVRRW